MRTRRLLPVLIPAILLLLGACDFIGGDLDTTIDADGAGNLVLRVGLLDEEGSTSCSSDDLPAGAVVGAERRGDELWCDTTFPFADLAGLRELYAQLGQESLVVHCLEMDGETLYYDVELVPTDPDDGSSGGEGAVHWRVTAPGPIRSHNADSVDGNTLTWTYTGPGSFLRFRVNTSLDEVCPSAAVRLTLDVLDDGTGRASLSLPQVLNPELANEFYAMPSAGWALGESEPLESAQTASAEWTDLEGLQRLIASIPGLAGGGSRAKLTVTEDEAGVQTDYTLEARFDLSPWYDFWERARPDSAIPPFFLDYNPPGEIDTVNGDWTDRQALTVTWIDQDPTDISLRVVTALQPELEAEIDPEMTAELIEELGRGFLEAIPAGQVATDPTLLQKGLGVFFAPGKVNNMTNWTTFACGDYQTRVIRWLDSIRTHPDPVVRAQLAGIDYGPIQAYRGGHQAVVVFPRGTDWQKTGTVFDPWPNQRPQIWTMEDWTSKFWWGVGVGEGGEKYPHMYRRQSHYAGTALPLERLHERKIAVNSPVAVLVVAADGRRVGLLDDGEFVYEIDGADFYPTPRGESEYTWYFGLPEGEYEVRFTGIADGDVHVLVADADGELVTYGPQAIEAGGTALLEVNPSGILQPLEIGGQEVAPIPVTEENVGDIEFGEPEASDSQIPVGAVRLGYLALLAICLLTPFAVAAIFFVRRKPRRPASAS